MLQYRFLATESTHWPWTGPRYLPVVFPHSLQTDSGMRFFHGDFCLVFVGWCFSDVVFKEGLQTFENNMQWSGCRVWKTFTLFTCTFFPVNFHGSSITIPLHCLDMYISKTPNSDFVMLTYIIFPHLGCRNTAWPSWSCKSLWRRGSSHSLCGNPLPRPWKRVVLQNARTPTGAVDWATSGRSSKRWKSSHSKTRNTPALQVKGGVFHISSSGLAHES